MKAYLGGPIFNVSRKDATIWRAQAREGLAKLSIGVNDPSERPYIPGKEGEVVARDLEEIRDADFLIAHIPEDTAMAGTPMEIFFAAFVLKIPVYTFPRNPSPWFIHWSTESFETLEGLLEHVWEKYDESSGLLQTTVE